MGNTPDKVQLTIKAEERLSPDMVGIELGVKVLDQSSKPVSGQPFKVHVDGEVLVQGATDENGEYNGQRVLTVQEGTQRKVFLVLEGSAATDWKVIGEQKHKAVPALDVTEIPNYVFWARMKDFTTTIKLPAHSLKLDEDHFIKLLAGQISLTKNEKKSIIRDLHKLRQEQVDELIRIFDEERAKFIELSPKHSVKLKELEDKAAADWCELEMEYEAGEGAQGADNVTTEEDDAEVENEPADTEDAFEEILNGNRAIKKGEEISLKKEVYRVTGDIAVEEGGRLIIEPGTTLEFEEGTGLVCKGVLIAVGTRESPIVFKPSESGWDNIALVGSGTLGSHLAYCVIEGGQGRNCRAQNGNVVSLSGPKKVEDDGSYGGGLLLLSTDSAFGFQKDDDHSPSEQEKIIFRFLIIRGNSAKHGGGGIHCEKSSPTIGNCRVENNRAMWGGGISLKESKTRVESSEISKNTASMGGGIAVGKTETILTDCLLDDNYASTRGGGIDGFESVVKIVSSKIRKNKIGGSDVRGGGGLSFKKSEIEILDSEIIGNQSEGKSGAIFVIDSKLFISRSKVNTNRAEKDAVIYCHDSDLTMTDSEVSFNTCNSRVVCCRRHRLQINRSRIKGNHVQEQPVLDVREVDYTVVDSEIQGDVKN